MADEQLVAQQLAEAEAQAMAEAEEEAIASMEAAAGYIPFEQLPGELTQEEKWAAEDALIQEAIAKDRASRPGALEQAFYGEGGKAAYDTGTGIDFKLGERPLGQPVAPPETALASPPPPVQGVSVPARPAADDDGSDLPYVPMVGGHHRAAAAYRRMGNLEKQRGDVEAKKLMQRFGDEQLTRAERNFQIRQDTQEQKRLAGIEFDEDMADAKLTRQYPGASIEQIKDWKYELRLNEDIKAGRRDISPEGAANVLRRAAVAKKKLEKAQAIDPGRAFGNAGSKILAALAVGAGSWAATRTGRNPALELYNKAIANDIAAQKEMFQHKRDAPTRVMNEYKFFMDKYNSDEVATLATAAAEWGVAAQQLNAQGLQISGKINQQKAFALAAEAQAKGEVLNNKAKQAAQRALALQYSGINDMQGKPIRWVGGKHGLEKQDPKEKEMLLAEREKANMLTVAIDKYIESTRADRAWMPGSEARAAAEGLREALVHGEGKFFGMGVLQQFERQFLESVIPKDESIPESIFTWLKGDSSRIAAYGEALKGFANDRFMGAVGALGNYEPWGGEKKYTVRKKGERGSSAADMALVKSRGK